MNSLLRQRRLWGTLLMLAVLPGLTAPVAHAHTRIRHSDAWAREHFAAAERLREALNGRPSPDRTRRDYQRVINAYRGVYLGAPKSSKADPSVVAVAETLVEMGRRFSDEKILSQAIQEYKFLRREYPGSRYRAEGLFTIAEIYKDDLNNPEAANASFEEFLRRYPNSRLAEDARKAITDLNRQARIEKVAKNPTENKKEGTQRKAGRDETNPDDSSVARSEEKNESVDSRKLAARVTGVRHWSSSDYSRVAIDLEGMVKFSSRRINNPPRILLDLPDTKLASTLVGKTFDVDDGFLKRVGVAQSSPGHTRVVLDVDNLSDYDAFLLPNPYRLVIDIHSKDIQAVEGGVQKDDHAQNPLATAETLSTSNAPLDGESSTRALVREKEITGSRGDAMGGAAAPTLQLAAPGNAIKTGVVKRIVEADDDEAAEPPARISSRRVQPKRDSDKIAAKDVLPQGSSAEFDMHEAGPTSAGDRSLIRALGLKIGKIVIDPGHGGHDTGTIGPNGLREKDLVLEVSRRLGKLLETRLGAQVVYTRKDDTFIPLETRTAIANKAHADLFVSVHANSSHDETARGVETYYLNFTSSPEALEVAARENAVSEKSIYELQDLVKKIALKEKIEESREFAWDVQQSLHSGLAVKSPAIRDRGVKKAPFIVLIGANMPSILAEISFVSNPADEHRLATSEYRERIAESLYRGIAKYVNGLSGVKVASKIDKLGGQ